MPNCSFNTGDEVGIPNGSGGIKCGRVISRVDDNLTGDTVLTVQFSDGLVPIDCADTRLRPCPRAEATRCGAPLRDGGACRRRVLSGGRCWQHR